jgi:rod shape-determining protein MreB
MLDLVSRVEPEYQERVRQNVILAGGGSQIPRLAQTLEAAFADVGGGRVTVVKDPVFAGANGSLALATDAPESDWEKLPG